MTTSEILKHNIYYPKALEKYTNFLCKTMDSRAISADNVSDTILNEIYRTHPRSGWILSKSEANEHKDFFRPTKENIYDCFKNNVWANCSFEDRIMLINLYLDKFFENFGVKPKLKIVLDKKTYNPGERGFYELNRNQIYVNTDELMHCNGVEILALLFHECSHAKDLVKFRDQTLPNMLENLCGVNHANSRRPYSFQKEIMDLNYEGNVHHRKLGTIAIDKKLRNDIVKAKNFFNVVRLTCVTPDKVHSREDMEKYMQNILYFYSPIERFARIATRNFLKSNFKDQKFAYEDEVFLKNQVTQEDRINKMLDEFKSYLTSPQGAIIDLRGLFDLYTKHEFYHKPRLFEKPHSELYPKECADVDKRYNDVMSQIYSNFRLQNSKNLDELTR